EHGQELFPKLLQQLEPFWGQRLTQDGDPFHEELIEVGSKDRQEFGPFEQRRALVHRLSQDALVKVQPAHVPIDPDVRQRRGNLYVQHSFITDRHNCSCGLHMKLLWLVQYLRQNWLTSMGFCSRVELMSPLTSTLTLQEAHNGHFSTLAMPSTPCDS